MVWYRVTDETGCLKMEDRKEGRLPICFHGQHGQKGYSDRLSPVKVTKTKGWDEEKAEREDLFTLPGMGTEKRRVQNRWPALKLRIRLGNWNWRMGRRLKFTYLISCSARQVCPGT